jgi:cell division protein FtsB
MKPHSRTRWTVLVVANVLAWCMLCFHQQGTAAPAAAPFANAVEQRIEMIEQLKQTNALLKEQNTLLRSGTLKVILAEKH